MPAAVPKHPTARTLRAYGLGKLDVPSAASVDSHLEQCPDCRRRVSEISGDSFLERLRDASVVPVPTTGVAPSSEASILESRSIPDAGVSRGEPPSEAELELAKLTQYEVIRELGRGGMGVVYLARNTMLDRLEVLKVLNRERLERRGLAERFLREMRSAAALSHQNVVTAYAAYTVGRLLVLAMEYVEGDDLAKLTRDRGPLPVPQACYFVYQAALGLQHAHEQKMVHRDIKPHNLILSVERQKATVKILDFGLAKAAREDRVDPSLTHEGQLLGTPDFVAPEQILSAQTADIRADIYSLGCTLYYLLSGGPPFRGETVYNICQAHISLDAKPINLERAEVPVSLAAVVAKMMAKDPNRRYQAPAAVAEALKPFFKKVTKVAEPVPAASALKPTNAAPIESALVSRTTEVIPPNPQEIRADPVANEVGAFDAGSLRRKVLFGAAAAFAAGMLGIVFYVATDKGWIKIEIQDPQATVRIDGGKVRIEPLGEPITLRVGIHELTIVRGDVEVETRTLIVRRGETQPVRIDFQPIAERPEKAPAPISQTAPTQPPNTSIEPAPVSWGKFDQATILSGEWAIRDGCLVQSQLGPNRKCLVFGDPNATDYDFEFDVMSTAGNHGFKAVFHQTARGAYEFALGNYRNVAHDLSFDYDRRWGRDDRNYIRGSIDFQRWYHVKVEIRGSSFRCFLDGVEMFHETDARFTHGKIGISTWNAAIRVKNIEVTSTDGKPIFRGLPRIDPN